MDLWTLCDRFFSTFFFFPSFFCQIFQKYYVIAIVKYMHVLSCGTWNGKNGTSNVWYRENKWDWICSKSVLCTLHSHSQVNYKVTKQNTAKWNLTFRTPNTIFCVSLNQHGLIHVQHSKHTHTYRKTKTPTKCTIFLYAIHWTAWYG